ncbi:hypothetical protein [Blastopirellula marina]|uniref:Uncharacterized protein n=1 Tax=Blastopirellula marina TaxID=124 RepID=A0A2S8GJA9_9BACT|nr:hypothetical protein [Blastopirellula marina]PQO44537.1 hypothetical protein C5Y93_19210 [Blastopirellula marina]
MNSAVSVDGSSGEKEVSSPPHFSLAYLFLWITTLSLALAGWILVMMLLGVDLAKDLDGGDIYFYGRHAFVLGTGLAGVELLAHWWRQGISYRWQPGDMLLVFLAVHELIRLFAVAVDAVVPPSNNGMFDENRALIYDVMTFSVYAVAVCMFAVGASRSRFSLIWRIGFGLLALVNLYYLIRVWPLKGFGASFFFELYPGFSVAMRCDAVCAIDRRVRCLAERFARVAPLDRRRDLDLVHASLVAFTAIVETMFLSPSWLC